MKCVFLDRDGVLNVDRGTYSWAEDHFKILPKVPETLIALKSRGFLLVVVTNQAGIAKGLYTGAEVLQCHERLQAASNRSLDDIFYSPHHPSVSESISRKPNSLLLERAISKFKVTVEESWMIGDKQRDITPAQNLGLKTILVGPEKSTADYTVEKTEQILQHII